MIRREKWKFLGIKETLWPRINGLGGTREPIFVASHLWSKEEGNSFYFYLKFVLGERIIINILILLYSH